MDRKQLVSDRIKDLHKEREELLQKINAQGLVHASPYQQQYRPPGFPPLQMWQGQAQQHGAHTQLDEKEWEERNAMDAVLNQLNQDENGLIQALELVKNWERNSWNVAIDSKTVTFSGVYETRVHRTKDITGVTLNPGFQIAYVLSSFHERMYLRNYGSHEDVLRAWHDTL